MKTLLIIATGLFLACGLLAQTDSAALFTQGSWPLCNAGITVVACESTHEQPLYMLCTNGAVPSTSIWSVVGKLPDGSIASRSGELTPTQSPTCATGLDFGGVISDWKVNFHPSGFSRSIDPPTELATSSPPQALPLNSSNWYLNYAYQTGKSGIPLTKTTTSLKFTYPLASATANPSAPYLVGEWAGYLQYVDYLNKKTVTAFSLTSITMKGHIAISSPSVVFDYKSESFNTCVDPGTLRPEFNGALPAGQDNRWWSSYAVLLTPGPFSLYVTMNPDYWSNSTGQVASSSPATLAAFQAAVSSAYLVGATNGGGCFYGHGIRTSGGSATLTLTEYAINQ